MELVPEHYRQGAEEVRQHLVMLRGGAPFLSPQCALQLIEWFDEDVGVPTILVALERAAEARRKKRSRIPLTLRAARRHLGKAGRATLRKGTDRSLQPLANHYAATDDTALAALCDELRAVEAADAERAMAMAMGLIRTFLESAWKGLRPGERERHLAAAQEDLGDLLHDIPEVDRPALVEEVARDALRQRYDALSAANVWELISP